MMSPKSDDQTHCSESDERTDCTSTTSAEHCSDKALKINKVLECVHVLY